ncbi:hypothetical protein QE375_003639 [Microbacterium foliorum]|uniref:Amino acid transporter n=1 Tax=Microbacterium foliorum TaxID=104336 RepID=A0ABU1HVK3_9MICO|nr:hypothetical protein [Microbacterium foliorum]MDR6144085.1 hypothetical protein [Microbacterium foliorum]
MSTPISKADTPWRALDVYGVSRLIGSASVRWWLSGGAALDRWVGRAIRPRTNIDVSVIAADLVALLSVLPSGFSAWAPGEGEDDVVPLAEVSPDTDPQPLLVRDDADGSWVLQINVEDGTDRAWVYKRDPRLQLPWERAVLDLDGVPTGAPEVQLVWKALRPRPEDELDKDAVVAVLPDDVRSWYERAILSIHPHSTWSIHVRSPFAPAKASWNRKHPQRETP